MNIQKIARSHQLAVSLQPYRNEGPKGYLLRLSEANLLTIESLKLLGVDYDYDVLLGKGLLEDALIDPDLHRHVAFISELLISKTAVWNEQFSRFCPKCLVEDGHWHVEWELKFYDVCHKHKLSLIDQCTTCGNKLTWTREELTRCSCGSILSAEETKSCPESMAVIAHAMSCKILQVENEELSLVLKKTGVEQTQRLIRYLGNYMSLASGKNPLKMRLAGDLIHSWPVTSLAAEVIADWPNAFHRGLTNLEKNNRGDGRFSLNEVFGNAYHYVFKALKEKPFEELRYQFELWISNAWKGGVAKRNKRLTSTILKDASWVPGSVACDYLGVSHQRLDFLIREGMIEGETHISEKGRKSVMIRRECMDQAKEHLFGQIDMTTAQRLLGLQKRRMRKLLSLLFVDAKKLGAAPGSPWAVSRLEVNNIIEMGMNLTVVSIPDEGCISFEKILQYSTLTNEDVAALICSVKSKEINLINKLDTKVGIAAWCFNESEFKNWKLKHQKGMGIWLTITQAAKLIGIKEQVAYELVKRGYLKTEIMPHQMKKGTRVRRKAVEEFLEQYIFTTKISEALGLSPRKVICNLSKMGIEPISGPRIDGLRQVLYLKSPEIDSIMLNHKKIDGLLSPISLNVT